MTENRRFELHSFLPYLLNQAAETTSRAFAETYRSKYGMLQTEWRVVYHLGRYGDLTAKEICIRARTHKTKVSRAVQALSQKRYVTRQTWSEDRRHEHLSLTPQGRLVFEDLVRAAEAYEAELLCSIPDEVLTEFRTLLVSLADGKTT